MFKIIEKSTQKTIASFENLESAQILAAQLRDETGEIFFVIQN